MERRKVGLGLERKGTAAVDSKVSGRTKVDQAATAQRVVRGLNGAGETGRLAWLL